MKFSFLTTDRASQAFNGVKCRDFLSDVLVCNWRGEKVSLYGFEYSGGTASTSTLIVEGFKSVRNVLTACRALGIDSMPSAIISGENEKKCVLAFLGGYSHTTYGISAASEIIRSYDLCGSYLPKVKRLNGEPDIKVDLHDLGVFLEKYDKDDELATDSKYCKDMAMAGGWALIHKLYVHGSEIARFQRKSTASTNAFHERGGIGSLCNNVHKYMCESVGKDPRGFVNSLGAEVK
jgi:hypothetical protein